MSIPMKEDSKICPATLYFSTNGNNWYINDGWLSNTDECGWFNDAEGSFCRSGAVLELDFHSNNLDGTLPDEIALLSNSGKKTLV